MLSEHTSPLGVGPIVIRDVGEVQDGHLLELRTLRAAVRVGVDRGGLCPDGLADAFDVLLTTAPKATREWISVDAHMVDVMLAHIKRQVSASPIAATILCQLLRAGCRMHAEDAFAMESLAYSTLLGGDEFRNWLERQGKRPEQPSTNPTVTLGRSDSQLFIRMDDPETHNAFSASMRDDLVEALMLARVDTSIDHVFLYGAGPSFSSGGYLAEFGAAKDLALAHLVRTTRSIAAELWPIADRVTVLISGACIGGGLEVAAAAGQAIATPNSVFRLPELGMGLIPGAGGTVTLPSRIGRWRTAFLALTGRPVRAHTALAWGLIDQVEADLNPYISANEGAIA